jgi:FkbM family methyltransferase
VVAFEPNPTALDLLELHIRMNRLTSIVRIVPAAAGAVTGEVMFSANGSDGMSRIGGPNPILIEKPASITVPVVRLDNWCSENAVNPDWLFIDIEGFEVHALVGASELIRSRGSTLGIVVEMHPGLWPTSGTCREEIATCIAEMGRRAVSITGQTDPYAEYGHVLLEPT